MPPFVDRTGQQFGSLTVLSRAENRGQFVYWKCKCTCGKEVDVYGGTLQACGQVSCGCGKKLRPYEGMYNMLTRARKAKRIGRSLSYEEFMVFVGQDCYYCGAALRWFAYNAQKHTQGYNLDRKDNSRGYHFDNCVACCISCNWIRRNFFTHAQFTDIGLLIRKWRAEGQWKPAR